MPVGLMQNDIVNTAPLLFLLHLPMDEIFLIPAILLLWQIVADYCTGLFFLNTNHPGFRQANCSFLIMPGAQQNSSRLFYTTDPVPSKCGSRYRLKKMLSPYIVTLYHF